MEDKPIANVVFKGSNFGYYWYQYYMEKYSWICGECGLIWFSRDQARFCSFRGHVSKYRKFRKEQVARGRVPKDYLIYLRLKHGLSIEKYYKKDKNPIRKTKNGNISWKRSTINLLKIRNKDLEEEAIRTKNGNISWKKTFINQYKPKGGD